MRGGGGEGGNQVDCCVFQQGVGIGDGLWEVVPLRQVWGERGRVGEGWWLQRVGETEQVVV